MCKSDARPHSLTLFRQMECNCPICIEIQKIRNDVEITIGGTGKPEVTCSLRVNGRSVTVRSSRTEEQSALSVMGAFLVAHGLVSPGDI